MCLKYELNSAIFLFYVFAKCHSVFASLHHCFGVRLRYSFTYSCFVIILIIDVDLLCMPFSMNYFYINRLQRNDYDDLLVYSKLNSITK